MFPKLLTVGNFTLNSYGLCAFAGIAAACPVALYYFKKRTGKAVPMIYVLTFAALGAFVGMHLLYGITNAAYWHLLFESESFSELLRRFAALFGGSVFYGGLLGGLLAGGISARVQRLSAAEVTDCAAPTITIIHGFGRIGCFMAGCCYGIEWEHGVTFTDSIVESANGAARVPVQLIEAGFELTLGLILWILLSKRKLYGRLLCVYLAVYSVGRFMLEFLRGDDYRGFIGGFSTSQLISVGFFTGTTVYLITRRKGTMTTDSTR